MQELSSLNDRKAKTGISSRFDPRPLIAFFSVFVFYVILSLICQKYPFGEFSTSVSDLDAQYAPFLALFRNRLTPDYETGNFLSSLMYSFDEGLGSNYMATFGYYLASPFNFLYALFDTTFISGFVLLILTLKMSFASCFMCMFLSLRAKDSKRMWPVLFGIVYAFSAYAIAFLFQIMWMDGYMLLPLLLFFTEKFIREGKKAGLAITLLLLFFTNFYIAYMVGIYSFLYLLFRLWYTGAFKDVKKALGTVGRFILTAVLDAMILCVFLIPVGLATIGNSDPTVSENKSHFVLYNLREILDHLFLGLPGEFGDVMPANLPFFFASTLVTALIIIFFVSKSTSRKDKIAYLLCLVGVYLSTAIYWFDIAWQVFDEPNWFWHRHSFVFLPLFFVIAGKAYEEFSKVTKRELLISFGILTGLLFLAQSIGSMKEDRIFLFNLAFIIALFTVLYFINKKDWSKNFADMPKILPVLLGVLISFEVVYVHPLLSTDISTLTLYQGSALQYQDSIRAMQDLSESQQILADKNKAFRAENEVISDYGTTSYILEHPNMYGDFHGMSFFNSSSIKPLHRFSKQLGYSVNYNYFSQLYSYCAPDSDAFLSIGAMTTMRDYSGAVYIIDDPYDVGYHYYANPNVLPLAFAADKGAFDFDFYQLEKRAEGKDYFAFRNLWYSSLFPDSFTEDYFITLGEEYVSGPVVTNGMQVNSELTTMADIRAAEMNASSEGATEEDNARDNDNLGREDMAADAIKSKVIKYYRTNSDIPIYLEFTAIAPADGEMYFNLVLPSTSDDMSIYVDNILISHASAGTYFSQINRLGTFKQGDVIKVTVTSDSKTFKYLDAYFGYFDYDKFDTQFDTIDKSKVTVDKACDGYVRLTADIGSDEAVITTVPYEKGWTLYIDGKEAEITPYQNAFIAFSVPSGSHTCELKFTAPGFKSGVIVSVAGIVGMAAFAAIDMLRKKKAASPKESSLPEGQDQV